MDVTLYQSINFNWSSEHLYILNLEPHGKSMLNEYCKIFIFNLLVSVLTNGVLYTRGALSLCPVLLYLRQMDINSCFQQDGICVSDLSKRYTWFSIVFFNLSVCRVPCKTFFLTLLEGWVRWRSMEHLSNSLHCCNGLGDPVIEWDLEDAFLYFMLLRFCIS